MKKGDFVLYSLPFTNRMADVRAIVRTMHRDGTVTIEARHVLDKNGKPEGGYLGYRYRVGANLLRSAA